MARFTRLIIGCLVMVAVATPARSALIFSDRAAFEAYTSGWILDFEGFEVEFVPEEDNGVFNYDFGDFEVIGTELSPAGFFWSDNQNVVSEGDYAIQYTSQDDGSEILFSFQEPIHVFGIDINDWGTWGSGVLDVYNDTGSVDETLEDVPPRFGRGETIFFGVVDNQPFSSMTVFSDTQGDIVGLDALTYGDLGVDQIPEPSSLFIWSLIGTLGLGYVARRRRRRAARQT